MIRMMMTALLIAVQPAMAMAAVASCAGADPAIISVAVKAVSSQGDRNRYELTGKVRNVGRAKQASNVLQFVDVFQTGEKKDAKSIPPLKPGQTFTFTHMIERSRDAGEGTTELTFQLEMRKPSTRGPQNCSIQNDRFTLRF
ncbi:MAG: hypothetical protein NVSMB31_00880 [Vulcanimicrobiaceae bacterium]